MLTTSIQFICWRISGIRDDQYQDWLDINQVSISNSMQIILTKLAVIVVRLPLTYFIFKISAVEELLISIGIMLQTFDAKYLNEFKPILWCWPYFGKNLFVILNYSLIFWQENITHCCIGEVFFHSEKFSGQTLDISIVNTDRIILLK